MGDLEICIQFTLSVTKNRSIDKILKQEKRIAFIFYNMSTNMVFVAQFCLCGSKFSEPIEKDSIVHSSQLDAQDSADGEYVAEPSPKIQHNIIHRINNLDRAGSALHQTLTLLCGRLNDEEKDVALHAAKMVHQYSGEKATCQAIISNTGLVAALVQVIWSSSDSETLSLVVSTLHNLSHHRNGLLAIFRNDIIPGLVKNLESPIESMVLEVMTILENLICNQAEPEEAFCSSGGISQLLQILQRNNVELLGRAMYFLGALAKDSPDYRNSIMAMNGVPEFLRILCTYNEEELLDDTLGVLIALSMDACNRRAIEIAGGVQILTNCMLSNSNRPILMQKCLWMMHLMAETIAFMTTMSSDELTQLLNILMVMLGASDILSVALAINTLCTLTGYGLKCLYFRQLLCRTNAVEVLIDTIIVNGADTEDISEMAVRILSNLTVQHEMAGMVRDSIRSTHDGILSIVELLIPAKQCNLIEAVVRLISNLALNRSNCEPLREAHALEHLIQLMEKAEQDLVSIHTNIALFVLFELEQSLTYLNILDSFSNRQYPTAGVN